MDVRHLGSRYTVLSGKCRLGRVGLSAMAKTMAYGLLEWTTYALLLSVQLKPQTTCLHQAGLLLLLFLQLYTFLFLAESLIQMFFGLPNPLTMSKVVPVFTPDQTLQQFWWWNLAQTSVIMFFINDPQSWDIFGIQAQSWKIHYWNKSNILPIIN